ncbi:hypothetical protein ANCDUO_09956 [Ancylostoma duodenale]|uniref:Receptor ligand binding region domain-containing protein n=1 Tax=Ancylostoma duodenale TaxID=51022 RepID=A0A0C2GF61_9BILA|nr:hypothetical protein ANCDUO_09956 [Ancylostoma duodenale]
MGECVESTDAGAVIAWAQTGADVVLGPACSASALISGTVGKYFNFPVMAQVLLQILNRYQWSEVALIYYAARSTLIPRCSLVMADLEDLTNGILNMTITYRRQLLNYNNDTFRSALKSIKDVSRITIACFESNDARRNFLIAVAEAGMDLEEYMWIMIESRKSGFANIWRDTKSTPDGKDAIALRAARKFFVIDVEPLNSTAQFIADVKQKMKEPPYNCNDCTDIDPQLGFLCNAYKNMDVGRVNLDIPDPRNDLFASDRARLTIMKLHQRFEHITYDSNVPNVIPTQDSGCEQICTVNYKFVRTCKLIRSVAVMDPIHSSERNGRKQKFKGTAHYQIMAIQRSNGVSIAYQELRIPTRNGTNIEKRS